MADSRIPPSSQQSDDEGSENSRNVLRTVSGGAPIAASSVDFDPDTGLTRVDHGDGVVTLDTGGAEVIVDPDTGTITVETTSPVPDTFDEAAGVFRPGKNRPSTQQSGTDPGGGGGGGGGDWGTGTEEPSFSYFTSQKPHASSFQSHGGTDTAALFARALHPAQQGDPLSETTEAHRSLREPTFSESQFAAAAFGDSDAEPRVEIDPDTGLVTIEHADGTTTLDPDKTQIAVDPDSGEITFLLNTQEDSEDSDSASSDAADTVSPGQITVDAETGLITIGYEGGRLTLDPATGETVLVPGDSPVSLDPDTGLLTVGSPEETDGPEEAEEGASDTDEEEHLFESGDALVSVDPETGLITIDHAGGRISVDPADGVVRVELGDGEVSVDSETGEITVTPAEEGSGDGAGSSTADTPGVDGDPRPSTQQDDGASGDSGADRSSTASEDSSSHSGQSASDASGPGPTPGPASALHSGGGNGDSAGGGSHPGDPGGSGAETGPSPTRTFTRLADNPAGTETAEDGSEDGEDEGNGESGGSGNASGSGSENGDQEGEDREDEGTGEGRDEDDEDDESGGSGNASGSGSEDGDQDDDEEETEDDEDSEDDEDDEDSGNDEGGGDGNSGDGSDGSGDGGGNGVVKIDFSQITEFNNTFVTNIQTKVNAALEEMSEYENTGKDHILVGNGAILEPAANLTAKVNQRLAEIYKILAAIEAEMLAISDNLTDTAVEFLMLEDDQQIDAQQLALIFNTGNSANSYTPPGPGSSSGSGSGSDRSSDSDSGSGSDEDSDD